MRPHVNDGNIDVRSYLVGSLPPVCDVVEVLGIANPFNETTKTAAKDWLTGFIRRHPELSIQDMKHGRDRYQVRSSARQHRGVEGGETNGEDNKRQYGDCRLCHECCWSIPAPDASVCTVEVLMNRAHPQSLGQANPSGWMDAGMFVTWLNHFEKFTNSSPTNDHMIVMSAQDAAPTPNISQVLEKCVRCGIRHMDGFKPGEEDLVLTMAGIFGTAYVRTSSQSKTIKGCQSPNQVGRADNEDD